MIMERDRVRKKNKKKREKRKKLLKLSVISTSFGRLIFSYSVDTFSLYDDNAGFLKPRPVTVNVNFMSYTRVMFSKSN